MTDGVESWVAASEATAAFTTGTRALDGCHKLTASEGGHTVAMSVEPLNLPAVGDASQAYEVSGTVEGIGFQYALDVARKGRGLVVFAWVSLGAPAMGQLEKYLRSAVGRVTG
jgi:hypothetical protein